VTFRIGASSLTLADTQPEDVRAPLPTLTKSTLAHTESGAEGVLHNPWGSPWWMQQKPPGDQESSTDPSPAALRGRSLQTHGTRAGRGHRLCSRPAVGPTNLAKVTGGDDKL